jgi:hypothetical protein
MMFPIDGVDRCYCGCKYFDSQGRCIDCGEQCKHEVERKES